MKTVVQICGTNRRHPVIVLPVHLTLPTARWIAQAFLRGTTEHPLHGQIPAARFGSMAVSTLEWPWRVTFGRRTNPAVMTMGMQAVMIGPSDRADFHLLLNSANAVEVTPPTTG